MAQSLHKGVIRRSFRNFQGNLSVWSGSARKKLRPRFRSPIRRSTLPHLDLVAHNPRMDANPEPLCKPPRLHGWPARHLAAILAVSVVLALLGWKTQYQLQYGISEGEYVFVGAYGWPWYCVERTDSGPLIIPRGGPSQSKTVYEFNGWRPLLLDLLVAVIWPAVIWLLFSKTQRRCQRWWQFSLATMLAFVTLAAVVCAVLKSGPSWNLLAAMPSEAAAGERHDDQ